MTTRDPERWNQAIILELVEGSLLNPKRLEEAIKVSRFVKRLMSFYHPFSQISGRFADLGKNEVRALRREALPWPHNSNRSHRSVNRQMGEDWLFSPFNVTGQSRWRKISCKRRRIFASNIQGLLPT